MTRPGFGCSRCMRTVKATHRGKLCPRCHLEQPHQGATDDRPRLVDRDVLLAELRAGVRALRSAHQEELALGMEAALYRVEHGAAFA